MLEKIKYVNHQGEVFNFGRIGVYANSNELRDYDWDYAENATGKILFSRKAKEKTLPIIIYCATDEEGIRVKNQMESVTEKDTLNGKTGKIYIGDYYIRANIVGSKKERYLQDKRYLSVNWKVLQQYPFWIMEHPYSFYASDITSTNNKRYANKYAYRYANGLNSTSIVNEHYTESNFRLNIYGACVKPSVYIGGYEYHINIVLEDGEYLEVDSATETVTKIMTSGIRVNAFNNRSFQNSVFRPIQTGKQDVFWDGKFDFDLTLYEERSEPKWL